MPPKAVSPKVSGIAKGKGCKKEEFGQSKIAEETSECINQNFELELCWCIKQLHKALGSGKLSNRRVQDHTKALNTLMSNSSPVIKKRQVMRLSFGDYRAKMTEESKKLSKANAQIKVLPGIPSKNSKFLRKSANMTSCSIETPSNIFDSNNAKNKSESTKIGTPFHVENSNNCFRFNFGTDG